MASKHTEDSLVRSVYQWFLAEAGADWQNEARIRLAQLDLKLGNLEHATSWLRGLTYKGHRYQHRTLELAKSETHIAIGMSYLESGQSDRALLAARESEDCEWVNYKALAVLELRLSRVQVSTESRMETLLKAIEHSLLGVEDWTAKWSHQKIDLELAHLVTQLQVPTTWPGWFFNLSEGNFPKENLPEVVACLAELLVLAHSEDVALPVVAQFLQQFLENQKEFSELFSVDTIREAILRDGTLSKDGRT